MVVGGRKEDDGGGRDGGLDGRVCLHALSARCQNCKRVGMRLKRAATTDVKVEAGGIHSAQREAV